jgi:hypothetical protein
MFKYYPLVLGIMDTISEWNEKLNNFSANNLDSVWVGTVLLAALFIIGCWGVNTLNKK